MNLYRIKINNISNTKLIPGHAKKKNKKIFFLDTRNFQKVVNIFLPLNIKSSKTVISQ